MNNMLAIDFGTSRTKAAYFDDRTTRKPQLMRLGRHGEPIPTVFYIEEDGTIRIGEDAEARIEEKADAVGVVELLKRKLKKSIWTWNRTEEPEHLLTYLFGELREQARGIPVFDQRLPSRVRLTVTEKMKGSDQCEILERAARAAGFEDVEFMLEPVAAARAWVATKMEMGGKDVLGSDVIVVDCGGGTLDWTYLHRRKQEISS